MQRRKFGAGGFEPPLEAPKAPVLPLDDTPMTQYYNTGESDFSCKIGLETVYSLFSSR
jgi:hypothetical protein